MVKAISIPISGIGARIQTVALRHEGPFDTQFSSYVEIGNIISIIVAKLGVHVGQHLTDRTTGILSILKWQATASAARFCHSPYLGQRRVIREKLPESGLAASIKRCGASMGVLDRFHAVLLRQWRAHDYMYDGWYKSSDVDAMSFNAPQKRLYLESTKNEHSVAGM